MKMIRRLVPMAAIIGGAILSMVLAPDVAWAADKRVALIVGNSSYQTVPQLPNPSRDANAVAKMFRDAGFDSVDIQLNVGNLEFKRSIRKFESNSHKIAQRMPQVLVRSSSETNCRLLRRPVGLRPVP